ncbi:hypothetical protein IMSAGC008_01969 [Muribaculaceae bacterium]|nr:hypothetical protein IMSAGC008_01969 [Muribaculaceae bacterium]
MIAVKLVARQHYQRSPVLRVHLHSVEYGIGVEAQAVLAVCVEQGTVKTLLVSSFFQQLGDNYVQLGVGTIVRKVACVGHHACKHALGSLRIYEIEQLQPAKEAEHQVARGRHLRVGDYHFGIDIGVKMVVYQYLGRRAFSEHFFKPAHTPRLVKIEAQHQIGFPEKPSGKIGIPRGIDYLLGSGQFGKIRQIGIGDDHTAVLAKGSQHMGSSK